MKRFILFLMQMVFLMGFEGILYADEIGDFRLMDWRKCSLSELTPGLLAIEGHQNTISASLKLKTKGPVFFREQWTPARLGYIFAVGDLDGDKDMDMLFQASERVGTIATLTAYENTGIKDKPSWRKRPDWDIVLDEGCAFPRLIDFDRDGDADLFVGRRICYYPPYPNLEASSYENIGTNLNVVWKRRPDWEAPPWPVNATTTLKMPVYSCPALGDLDGDEDIDLAIVGINDENMSHPYPGYLQASVCFWRNDGTLSLPIWNKAEWYLPEEVYEGVENSGHGPFFNIILFDRNMDGKMDLAVSIDGENIFWYKNIGSITSPLWEQYGHNLYSRAHNACPYIDVGDMDSDSYLEFLYGDNGNLIYVLDVDSADEYKRYKPKHKWEGDNEVARQTCPVFVDIDSDSDYDMCWGNGVSCDGEWAKGFENIGSKEAISLKGGGFNGKWWFYHPTGYPGCPIIPRAIDLDGDSDYDMVFGDDFGHLCSHRNIGSPNSPSFEKDPLLDLPRIDPPPYSPTGPSFADMDMDGDYDAFIIETDTNGNGGGTKTAWFYENIGTAKSPAWKRRNDLSFILLPKTVNCTYMGVPILEDLDQDGDYDLIVGDAAAGIDGSLSFYENIGSSTSFKFSINPLWKIPWEGIFSCSKPALADIDNDGDLDLFLGNSPGECTVFENIGEHYSIGTYTSSIFPKKDYKKLFWKETVPNRTSIKMFIRKGETPSPDASWSNWEEIENGSALSCSKYIQYRAVLSTLDLKKSPILYETILTYGNTPLSILPVSGKAGERVTVQGSGFSVNKQVTIDFGTKQTITTTISSPSGTFSAVFMVNTQPKGLTKVLVKQENTTLTDYFIILEDPLIGTPSIFLKKSCDKSKITKGGTITYTITYTNEGEGTATDVVIIEVLPEKCRIQNTEYRIQNTEVSYWYDGDWQSNLDEKATKIRWLIPEVAPASSGTASFTVEVR
ncbi:MAG: VCBS repeat-containing protein [Candidatus Desantisbacteria bacterium]